VTNSISSISQLSFNKKIDSEELVNSRASEVPNVGCIDDIITRYPEIFEVTVGCIP
jgi:hypothetical protein